MTDQPTAKPTTVDSVDPKRPPRKPRWPLAIAALALIHPIAYGLARWNWWADLIAHFRVPAALVSLTAALALAHGRRRVPASACFLGLALIQAIPSFWLIWPITGGPADRDAPGLRVFFANVLIDNLDHGAAARAIRAERPDLIGLVEVSPEWVEGLDSIRREYPYRVEFPTGVTGLVLWSKLPMADARAVRPSTGSLICLTGRVPLGAGSLRVWLVHTKSPMARRGEVGFAELDALAGLFASRTGPRLAFGDFNTTDGSPHFGALLAKSGLRDGRLGFGAQPSWPIWSPLRITIDHTLISKNLALRSRKLGPAIGSDHLPVVFEVAPTADLTDSASASEASTSADPPP